MLNERHRPVLGDPRHADQLRRFKMPKRVFGVARPRISGKPQPAPIQPSVYLALAKRPPAFMRQAQTKRLDVDPHADFIHFAPQRSEARYKYTGRGIAGAMTSEIPYVGMKRKKV